MFLMKIQTFFNLSFHIICSIGLLYQFYELYSQYVSGKTVVNIEVKRIVNETLPGITVCYPIAFSFEKISHLVSQFGYYSRNSRHRNYYVKSSVYPRMMYELASLVPNMTIDYFIDNFTFSIRTQKTRKKISFFKRRGHVRDGIFNARLSAHVLTRMEVQHSMLRDISKHPESHPKLYDFEGQLIESISLSDGTHSRLGKCFTFFSHLDSNWTNFKMIFDHINLIVSHDEMWYPIHLSNKIFLAIHSPNILPELTDENFSQLTLGKAYQVKYSRLEIKLLKGPYDTDCQDYGEDDENFELVTDCYAKNYKDAIKSDDKFSTSGPYNSLLRKGLYPDDPILVLGNSSKYFSSSYTGAHKKCKNQCETTYFENEIRETNNSQSNMINIRHNKMPDIVVTHLPETTFISFVSNFGGLLGMWLGISILMVFEDGLTLVTKFTMFTQTNNFTIYANKVTNYINPKIKYIRRISRRMSSSVGIGETF